MHQSAFEHFFLYINSEGSVSKTEISLAVNVHSFSIKSSLSVHLIGQIECDYKRSEMQLKAVFLKAVVPSGPGECFCSLPD